MIGKKLVVDKWGLMLIVDTYHYSLHMSEVDAVTFSFNTLRLCDS